MVVRMARTSFLWINKDLLHRLGWKLSQHWWWGMYRNLFVVFPSYTTFLYSNNCFQQAEGTSPPTISRSRQPIKYSQPTNYPLITCDAPSLADVAADRKRKMTSTKRTARRLKAPLAMLWPLHRHQMPMLQQVLSLLHRKVIGNFSHSSFWLQHIPYWSYHSAFWS